MINISKKLSKNKFIHNCSNFYTKSEKFESEDAISKCKSEYDIYKMSDSKKNKLIEKCFKSNKLNNKLRIKCKKLIK